MEKQMETVQTPADKSLFVKMVVSAWDTQNARVNSLLEKLSDDQLQTETAPGRNTGHYLLGHLAAVNDALFPILGWGERLHPQLEEVFLESPDKSGHSFPSPSELKSYWKEINSKLAQHIAAMEPDDWFTRHNNVSAEDFEKEPHRNKLNILINRANHESYHLGQLAYLVKK
jgi:hypothetical protein